MGEWMMTRQLWWLSFADGARPQGQQFLGVAIVPADDMIAAVRLTHRLGINPGGEVRGGPLCTIPAGLPTERLLDAAEAREWATQV